MAAAAVSRADPGDVRAQERARADAPAGPPGPPMPRCPGLLIVAECGRYGDWADGLVPTTEAVDGPVRRLLIRSPLLAGRPAGPPTGPQWPLIGLPALGGRLRRTGPDVILVATTGPLAGAVIRTALAMAHRPAIITGRPQVAARAEPRLLRWWHGADAVVVHSRRERAAVAAVCERDGLTPRLVLARSPFLPGPAPELPVNARSAADDAARAARPWLNQLVFAAQRQVPSSEDDRIEVLRRLAEIGASRPELRVVLATGRTRVTQRPEHADARGGYEPLWCRVHRRLGYPRRLLTFGYGSLGDWLVPGSFLVTIGSAAVLAAAGRGLPAIVLTDFGVSDQLGNADFAGSGLLGSFADVYAGRLRHAAPPWLAENGFHADPSELPTAVRELAAAARHGLRVDARPDWSARAWLRSALPPSVGRRMHVG